MKKILAVDDSKLMTMVIKNFVSKMGDDYEIITRSNGKEAVEAFQQEKPDLVFLDIKMPEMDGLTALKKIRELDSSAKVVMCTALKEPEQEAEAKKLGAVGYIKKPFSKEEIQEAIRNI